ncbi:histidine kinase [Flavobacterium sp.]|uniref:sensor histidine kinase n=1 Tax=Flavobacterium sp. TaxID=239 RepID=UPI00286E6171|nr:histidine kinase [Flavobacterium sp.]
MKKRIVRHFLFWLAYLSFEVYTEFEWVLGQYKQFSTWEAFTIVLAGESILVFAIKIPIVYVVFYFLNKYIQHKITFLKLSFNVLLSLVFILYIYRLLAVNFIIPYVYGFNENTKILDFQGVLNSFMDTVFILVASISFKQYSVSEKLREKQQLLEKEKLETELNFLKAQINPHFLFNTLNNIYALAIKKSDQTPDVVIKLSKLLRFVLYETKATRIAINKEIQFLNDYIELEKIRYNNRLKIEFNYKIDSDSATIVPLLLIPFVENAFKHGASETISKGFIKIQLKVENNELFFQVDNTFEYVSENEIRDGIGLKNLKRQLELMYPGFVLNTATEGVVFKSRLQLFLN